MTHAQLEQARRIKSIERAVEATERRAAGAIGAPILFFDASSHLNNLSFSLAAGLLTMWSLRAAGRPVRYLHCRGGLGHCVQGTLSEQPTRPPPCELCTERNALWYPRAWTLPFSPPAAAPESEIRAIQTMRLEDLVEYEFDDLPLGKLCLPSARWILRCHDLAAHCSSREVLAGYVAAALGLAGHIERSLDEVLPSALLLFNGTLFPEATVRAVAMKRGLSVVTYEIGFRPLSAFFTSGEATAYALDIPESFSLDSEMDRRLDEDLAERARGRSSMGGVRFWPEMESLSEALRSKCDHARYVVSVFTNVIFDTSQTRANTVFAGMFDWLESTVQAAIAHPNSLFVIRAHPDELRPGKSSLQTVGDWLWHSGYSTLPNVHFIPPNEYSSSYELLSASDFCIVYNSTMGVEATIEGKPTIAAGDTKYSTERITHSPSTPEAYRRLLDQFLDDSPPPVGEDRMRRARRYMYFLLFQSSLDLSAYIESLAGYDYTFREFGLEQLLPENSPELKIIHRGLAGEGSFFYE